MVEKAKSFWSSLPGILTGIAAVITALTGFYAVYASNSSAPVAPVATEQVEEGNSSTSSLGPILVKQAKSSSGSVAVATAPPVAASSAEAATASPEATTRTLKKAPFAESGPLVDCTLFSTVNKVGTLMNWSNYYHKQIVDAGDVKRRATEPCNKAIDYRSMAHCEGLDDLAVRQELLETLTLCRAAGIEWRDIQRFK